MMPKISIMKRLVTAVAVPGSACLLFLALVSAIAMGPSTAATAQDAAAAPPATPAAKAAVELVIDYGDGVEKRFSRLAHRPELTVLDALQLAASHPRGVRFEHRGKGETAFVTRIDDLSNEGRGRNWTYRVNGQRADRSAGVWTLSAGDKVVWTFGGQ